MVTILRGIDLQVPTGCFFTLLGPSGCGKTTILRCTAGLETPEAGEIRIADQVVFSAHKHWDIPPEKRPIGMVFQSYAIWPHMTVFENAAYPLRYGRKRVPRAEIPRRVGDMLTRLGLSDFANRWATQLSGGQQQRLALARALLAEPELLLLDEPLSNLDAKMRAQLRLELKNLQRQTRVTTLYVTHDQSEALAMSDYIAVIQDGQILQVGTPLEIYANPKNPFVARFIGNANLFAGQFLPSQDGVRCSFGVVHCELAEPPTAAVWICIRPEDVVVAGRETEVPTINCFVGKVQSVEFLGDFCECVVDLDSVAVRLKVHRRTAIGEGQTVTLHFPPAACHSIVDDTQPPLPGSRSALA